MTLFDVRLFYKDDDDGLWLLAQGQFYGETEADAEECAMAAWWDPRLEEKGYKPFCRVTRS